MAGSKISARERDKLKFRRTIIVVILLSLLLIAGITSAVVARHREHVQSLALIYGQWEEQNVPKYAKDIFEVHEDGVYIKGRIVDTKYSFDGRILTYQYEGKIYKYKVLDEDITELLRVAPLHYETSFLKRGH